MVFYRITTIDDNLINTKSVEIDFTTRDNAALIHDCNVEDLDEVLELKNQFYDESDSSIRWMGVCCCDSIEALAGYVGGWYVSEEAISDKVVIAFEGDWLDSCAEGDVVIPKRIITTYPIEILIELL